MSPLKLGLSGDIPYKNYHPLDFKEHLVYFFDVKNYCYTESAGDGQNVKCGFTNKVVTSSNYLGTNELTLINRTVAAQPLYGQGSGSKPYIQFDGVDDTLIFNSSSAEAYDNHTIVLKGVSYYTASTTTVFSYRCQSSNIAPDRICGLFIRHNSSTNNINCYYSYLSNPEGSGSFFVASCSQNMVNGEKFNIAFKKQGTSIKVFWNGSLDVEHEIPSESLLWDDPSVGGTTKTAIGSRWNDNTGTSIGFFKGIIDGYIAIFSEPLSDNQCRNITAFNS